ncbi:sensor histidine kinase [Streptomyces sp. ST2-7A]|uniref:ATP-binding protein n=1 Tax=Streptomyces sp. ST2-7A TaxID=2907214 RepID=UPI001F3BF2C8|nr:sensor histidine kinase [Streptomyces sp. ST2-7A]MCE7080960.1 sensor histidine kinase [Streptomyces sp. ST2-7A]
MHARLSLARQLLLLQLAVIVLLLGSGTALIALEVRRDSRSDAEERALTLATGLSRLPEVRASLKAPDPTAELRPTARAVREATGTDFIVFMTPDGIRYTHPDPTRIGGRFLGTIEPARHGEMVTEQYEGTLGTSVRAVVPIHDDPDGDGEADGEVIGLLSVGILQDRIGGELRRRLAPVVWLAGAALSVGAAGSWAVSRRLDRQTLGLGAAEITRLYEHHDAVLRAVREGLLIVDPTGRLVLVNDPARRLLGLPAEAEGRRPAELAVRAPLDELLATGESVTDRLCVYGDRVLVLNTKPIEKDGRRLGNVITLRDHTELEELAGELDSARGFADALRAQAHESANRLHTVITMVELGQTERAVEFATVEVAAAQQLADRMTASVTEPALAALLLGKAAQAAEKGVELVITEDTEVDADLTGHRHGISPRDLVTLVGNLVDNAIDAALAAPPPRRVTVTAAVREEGPGNGGRPGGGEVLLVRVADTGTGVDGDRVEEMFRRGWSTKTTDAAHGRGLGLALVRQVIDRYGGSVEVTTGGPGPGDPGEPGTGPGETGSGDAGTGGTGTHDRAIGTGGSGAEGTGGAGETGTGGADTEDADGTSTDRAGRTDIGSADTDNIGEGSTGGTGTAGANDTGTDGSGDAGTGGTGTHDRAVGTGGAGAAPARTGAVFTVRLRTGTAPGVTRAPDTGEDGRP